MLIFDQKILEVANIFVMINMFEKFVIQMGMLFQLLLKLWMLNETFLIWLLVNDKQGFFPYFDAFINQDARKLSLDESLNR